MSYYVQFTNREGIGVCQPRGVLRYVPYGDRLRPITAPGLGSSHASIPGSLPRQAG
jgi:hypothetical protein